MNKFVNLLACLFMVFASSLVLSEEPVDEGDGREDYIQLKPGFVANYGGAGRLRYVKVDIALRVASSTGETLVRQHMAPIRHAIVMQLSNQTEDSMLTSVGKEDLRRAMLEEIRQLLNKEEGKHHIKDLLFNNFIIQQ